MSLLSLLDKQPETIRTIDPIIPPKKPVGYMPGTDHVGQAFSVTMPFRLPANEDSINGDEKTPIVDVPLTIPPGSAITGVKAGFLVKVHNNLDAKLARLRRINFIIENQSGTTPHFSDTFLFGLLYGYLDQYISKYEHRVYINGLEVDGNLRQPGYLAELKNSHEYIAKSLRRKVWRKEPLE